MASGVITIRWIGLFALGALVISCLIFLLPRDQADIQIIGPSEIINNLEVKRFRFEKIEFVVRHPGKQGMLWGNAPIFCTVTPEDPLLMKRSSWPPKGDSILSLRTDAEGHDDFYVCIPNKPGNWIVEIQSSQGGKAIVKLSSKVVWTPPYAPSGLVATDLGNNQTELTWLDNSSDEDSFRVQEKNHAGEWKTIAELPANTTRYVISSTKNDLRITAFKTPPK